VSALLTIDGYEYLIFRRVQAPTFRVEYANAVRRPINGNIESRKDGTPQRFILKIGKGKQSTSVIWIGSIDVLSTYCAYEIDAGRKLRPTEWSRYYRVRSINAGGAVREREIPSMDLRQTQQKAAYIDKLDWGSAGNVTDLRNYVLSCVQYLGDDDGMSIHGQGPLYLDSGELIFAYRSGAYDANGPRSDIRVNVSHIPSSFNYYDVTPRSEISDKQIQDGIREFRAAFTESPRHPEIPAAFIGQLFTAPVSATHKEFWSGLVISGIRGSGKSYLCNRYDSIQSRRERGLLQTINPVINLGDTTGTVKGQQYRAGDFAGVAITTDDIIKSGDSDGRQILQSEVVSNLARSFESGGAARARVNRDANRVESAEAPGLRTSVRFASEVPIRGDSTNDRLIRLPHLTESWGKGKIFDTEKSKRLSSPESRELQHCVWSAYVQWIIPRIGTELAECYRNALTETATWEASARMSDRYAAVITGLYAFAAFARENGVTAGGAVQAAVKALRACAERQAQSSKPPAQLFRTALRDAARTGRVSFPGPPRYSADGIQESTYSEPWTMTVKHDDAEDRDEEIRALPRGIEIADLGLELRGGGAGTSVNPLIITRVPSGFLIPPRQDTGGKKGSDLTRKWLLAMNPSQWKELCRIVTPKDGAAFTPNDVANSLQILDVGGRERVCMPKQCRAVVIDCEWALGPNGDDE
jgi:hypothetical protein